MNEATYNCIESILIGLPVVWIIIYLLEKAFQETEQGKFDKEMREKSLQPNKDKSVDESWEKNR